MPDPPIYSRRLPQQVRAAGRPNCPVVRYAELHCLTNFSFLEGASHADELVARAVELGYEALAITDRNSLAGVVRAHTAAKDSGLKLIIGAEVTPADASPVVLLATDRAAYAQLTQLLTVGRRRAEKGECEITLDDVAQYHHGLIAMKRCQMKRCQDPFLENRFLTPFVDIFADRCYLLAELHYGTDDARRLASLQQLSRAHRLPLVAAGDVHYHVPERMPLQHVLTAIRHGTTVAKLGERCLPNAQRHMRPLEAIQTIYATAPDAVRRTSEIAERCTFSLDELRYEYPEELAPAGEDVSEYLSRLAWQGAKQRYGESIPAKIRRLLAHELELIHTLHYDAFFLTVYDLVRFARSRNILCQGRGSAANSVVCYCLGITEVDPNQHELLFERFVSQRTGRGPRHRRRL